MEPLPEYGDKTLRIHEDNCFSGEFSRGHLSLDPSATVTQASCRIQHGSKRSNLIPGSWPRLSDGGKSCCVDRLSWHDKSGVERNGWFSVAECPGESAIVWGEKMYFQSLNRVLVLALLASTQFHGVDSSVGSKSNNNEVPKQQNGSDSKGTAGCAIEMLSDTEGVDFNLCLRDVYFSVKKNWFANMPPSLERGQQGINKVELPVLQDGSVPKDFLKMVQSSEKSDFDTASLQVLVKIFVVNSGRF